MVGTAAAAQQLQAQAVKRQRPSLATGASLSGNPHERLGRIRKDG
jgi:hypothetical protein